jgi:hypothetical protein
MKRIKLFENFNTNNPLDVRDDIKSILYELEDAGLNPTLKVNISLPHEKTIDSDELENYLDTGAHVRYFKLEIETDNGDVVKITPEIKERLERFIILLREHLDYIDSENIKIQKNRFLISIKPLVLIYM